MHCEFEFKSMLLFVALSLLYYTFGNDIGYLWGGAAVYFVILNWRVLMLIVLIALFNAFLASLIRMLVH